MRYIWTPNPHLSGLGKLALGIGFIAFVIFSIFIAVAVAKSFPPDYEEFALLLACVCVTLVIVGFVWAANRSHRSMLLAEKKYRTLRLSSVRRHPGAPRRLPHRMVEGILRGMNLNWSIDSKCARLLNPGDTICLNYPREPALIRPVPTRTTFEPIEIPDDVERIESLLNETVEAYHNAEAGDHRIRVEEAVTESKPLKIKSFFVWIWQAFWFLFLCAILVKGLYGLLTQGLSSSYAPIILLYGGLILGAWLMSYLFEKKWWIVPGGIVMRWSPFYRTHPKVLVFTPDDSALLVDFRVSRAVISQNGKAYRLACPDFAPYAVLAAWLSQARRPSRHELDYWFTGVGPPKR